MVFISIKLFRIIGHSETFDGYVDGISGCIKVPSLSSVPFRDSF